MTAEDLARISDKVRVSTKQAAQAYRDTIANAYSNPRPEQIDLAFASGFYAGMLLARITVEKVPGPDPLWAVIESYVQHARDRRDAAAIVAEARKARS